MAHGRLSAFSSSGAGGGGLSVGISGPATAAGSGPSQTTNTITATPSGGTSPYTYAWTRRSGTDATLTINSATAASTSFSKATVNGETYNYVVRCTVTDNVGNVAYAETTVTIQDTDPGA